jgi:glycosyltransferase involved in cell wall biosynthesis
MRVAVLFLDYLRRDHSAEAAISLVSNPGHDFDLFHINRKGIAAAINEGIDRTRDYDAIVTCANDIVMPPNWLAAMVEHTFEDTGMCGIHCVEGPGQMTTFHGREVYKAFTAFGNVLIPRRAIDAVGYFNEDYDPYGMQDSDYALRLNSMGFVNYYIPGYSSKHIGHDVGLKTDYRAMKDEGLATVSGKWSKWSAKYAETGNYTIFEKQYPGE